MKPAKNLIDLKKNYPKVYNWLINIFAKNGFKYYRSPEDALSDSLIKKLDIDRHLPLFAKQLSSVLPTDYIQYTHGAMDVSNCNSDKSFKLVSRIMTKLTQKIYNPYNVHLSLSSAKKHYPSAFKFLMTNLLKHGFTYLGSLSKSGQRINKYTDVDAFIDDPASDIFSTLANGRLNYLQLTSDGRWNLTLCDSYVKPTALTIIQTFFNLVHTARFMKTHSSSNINTSHQAPVRYLGLGTKFYVGNNCGAKRPNMILPIVALDHGRATVKLISFNKFEADDSQSHFPLFSKAQIVDIKADHLIDTPIVWIPYDKNIYQHLAHYVDTLCLKLFNNQMKHYLIVLDSFYVNNDIHFDLLVRNNDDSKHLFKIVNRSLSQVLTDDDDFSITSKEVQTRAYSILAITYRLYIERIPVNGHALSELLSYANTMPERRRYVVVNIAKNSPKLENAKFNVLHLSNIYNHCDEYKNVSSSELIYNAKYHVSKSQAIVIQQSDNFSRKDGDAVIPLDICVTDRLDKFLKKHRNN